MAWILLVLAYGAIKGLREISKKKALTKNTVLEVLVVYTVLSFLIVLPDVKNAVGVSAVNLGWLALKSFIIFIGWICGFKAMSGMPVSLYGAIDLSRVLFSTLLGIAVLGERLTTSGIIGLILVILGLLLLNLHKMTAKGSAPVSETKPVFVIYALVSCFLSSVSALMDKLLLSYTELNDSQVQFWYLLFLALFYVLYVFIARIKINWRSAFKNIWVWLLAVLIVVADRALFIANSYPDSKVTIMTLLKQFGCIVTILGGRIVFKEKHIHIRLMSAFIVILGIAVSIFL